jgi:MFS family permease
METNMNSPIDTISPALNRDADATLKRAYARAEWRIVPLLFGLWLLAWVDRANVSFAKLQMLSDLQFSEAVYGFGAGLFFLGYVIFGVPSTLFQQRVGARKTIAAIAIGWGATSIAMTFIHGPMAFYALRFLLGVFEAGFYPGVILYFTYWFPAKRRTRNFSIFHSAAICSTVVVGLTGSAVLEHMSGYLGVAGWRWMFLFQAAPTLLLGCVAVFVLPDRPARARWLTDEQKRLIESDLARENSKMAGREDRPWVSLRTPTIWNLILIYFCILSANAALSFYIPTILKEAGFGGYSAIGNALAAICVLGALLNVAFSSHAARRDEIRYHCAVASVVSVVSLVALVLVWHENRVATFVLLVTALAGTGAGISLFWQIPGRMLSGSAAAVGIAFISSAANLAGFFTPWLTGLVRTLTGHYTSSFLTVACIQAIAAIALFAWTPVPGSKK